MSNRLLKCYWCEQKDREDKIEIEHGKQKRRYHTLNCYQAYLDDQEFKQKEKEELDELVEVVKSVHGIDIIPNQFYPYLQDIRNGNELFGRIGQKKSKGGYSYSTIAQTYQESQDKINWALNNKNFKDTFGMLKYTIAIIRSNVSMVDNKIESRKRKQEIEQATEEQAINVFEHVNRQPVEYKRKKSKYDTSAFLD